MRRYSNSHSTRGNLWLREASGTCPVLGSTLGVEPRLDTIQHSHYSVVDAKKHRTFWKKLSALRIGQEVGLLLRAW